MDRPAFLPAVVALTLLAAMSGEAQERIPGLENLASRIDLTEPGVRRWLERLGAGSGGPLAERLLAVSPAGDILMERDGERSMTRIDGEFRSLLLRPDLEVILVHNHPANAGLSGADMRQLANPAVAAVVAIGHDGSVYMAAAGPRFDAGSFVERQYAFADAEVTRRLRAERLSTQIPIAAAEAHFSHLLALTLARAGVVQYWFSLRGPSRDSYAQARIVFGRVVVGAAARLKNGK
jgi:hypothetical protein